LGESSICAFKTKYLAAIARGEMVSTTHNTIAKIKKHNGSHMQNIVGLRRHTVSAHGHSIRGASKYKQWASQCHL